MQENQKVWDKEAVIALLYKSNLATGRALWSLYQRQTNAEQAAGATRDHNGVGFNGRDAEFLSDIAKRLPTYGYTLTPRQLPHVRGKLKKYTRQLLEIIEEKGGKVEKSKPRKSASAKEPKSDPAKSLIGEQATSPESEIVANTVTVDRPDQFGLF